MSYLKATCPVVLDSIYQTAWFDSAHQHSLLYYENAFYSWSHHQEYFQARLVMQVGDPKLVGSNPYFAILSLDSQIIAVQINRKTILVLDCYSRRTWSIRIKSTDGNSIIKRGLIWSEHGGNSQDLIIVTARGLELYKISPARNQCKLSRYIAIPDLAYYWYEPNHRMILLASPQRIGKNSAQEVFKMTGFFFRAEISDLPKLELPPPEKIQPFDLGPGLLNTDISLVTLYGNLYCTVHYTLNGQDYITMYGISKSVVVRSHTLSLNQYSPVISISVVDNLLCCHMYACNAVALFDLKRPAPLKGTQSSFTKEGFSSKQEGGSANVSQSIEPICEYASVIFDEIVSPLPRSKRPSLRPNVVSTPIVANNAPNESEWDAMGDSTHVISEVFASQIGGITEENQISHHEDFANEGTSNSVAEIMDGKEQSSTFLSRSSDVVTTPSPPITSPSSPCPMKSESSYSEPVVEASVYSTDVIVQGSIMDAMNTPLQVATISPPAAVTTVEVTVVPTNALQYLSMEWQFLPPYWIWHKASKCMWKLTCTLDVCSKQIDDTRRALLFLALRGQPFRSPKPVFRSLDHISQESKAIMLERLFSAVRTKATMTTLENLFKLVVTPYSNELKRLTTQAFHDANGAAGSMQVETTSRTTNAVVSDGSKVTTSSSQSMSIRQTWVGSIFSGGLSASASNSNNNSGKSGNDGGSCMDSEPIEPGHAMYLFLPNINAVCGKVRSRNRSKHDQAGMYEENLVVKVPLSARRDMYGALIISQTEMLSYVWLPIILQKPADIDLGYIRWSLYTYITALRGANPPVPVHPCISILLMNLLVLEGRFAELSHLVQLQFFPVSIEVAMGILELSDIVAHVVFEKSQDDITGSYDTKQLLFHCEYHQLNSSVQIMQQVGLDMLWRMQEKTTVVRWLLGRGRVLEAMPLCTKVRGQFRQGLSPGSISGVDFYLAALEAIKFIGSEFIDLSQPDEDSLDISVEGEPGDEDWDDDDWVDHTEYEDILKSRRAELLHTVIKFIKDWDYSVLVPNPTTANKSRISMHAVFPDQLFTMQQTVIFKELLGYG